LQIASDLFHKVNAYPLPHNSMGQAIKFIKQRNRCYSCVI